MSADRRGSAADPTTAVPARSGSLALVASFVVAGSATLGLSLLLLGNRTWSWSGDASLALLVAGIGLISGPFLRPSGRPSTQPSERGPTRPDRAASANLGVTSSEGGYRPDASESTDYSEGAELARPSKLPEHWSTSWMAAASVPEVADVLWQSWNVTPGELPVALAPPVPETAYVERKPTEPALHEEGEPVALETLIAGEPSYWAAREPSEPAPPEPSVAIAGPAKGASSPVLSPSLTLTVVAPGAGISMQTEASPRILIKEATDPTPPHLRHERTHRATAALAAPRKPAAEPAVRCASCHKWVHDPKFWSRCGDCHSHLCTPCVVESLLAYEWAWCTHCVGLRHMNSLVHEVGPTGPTALAPQPSGARRARRPLSVKEGGIRPARWHPAIGSLSASSPIRPTGGSTFGVPG